jgi:peptidoglycan/LPS O-acetylase OafA/YrhL
MRRLLRLWPALLTMVGFFTLAYSLPVKEWLPAITYTANFTRMVDSMFDEAYPFVLGHTWSLALEEQFYLIWPLLLLAIFRARNPIFWVIILATLTGTWRLVMLQDGDQVWRMLQGLDTRADALMIGSALAFAAPTLLSRMWPIGVAFLAWMSQIEITTSWIYMWGFPLIALAAASVIAKVSTSQEGLITRVLELSPIRMMGVISYAFYLWHFPILWFFHQHGKVTCLAVSVAMAYASWIFIEQPLRRKREAIIGKLIWRGRIAETTQSFRP